MPVTVDVSDLVQQLEQESARMSADAAVLVLESCIEDCPVGVIDETHRTAGRLRDSLRILDGANNLPVLMVAVGSELDYAQYTDETDTGVHLIPGSPLLRFYWEPPLWGDPGIYYFSSVMHPGTRGQRWFASRMEDRWERALGEVAL